MKRLVLAVSSLLACTPAWGLTMHFVPIVDTVASNSAAYTVVDYGFTLPAGFQDAVLTIDTADITGGAAVAAVNGRSFFAVADNGPGRGYFQLIAGGALVPVAFAGGGLIDTAYAGIPFQVGANVLRMILNTNPFGVNAGARPPVPGNATLNWAGSVGFSTRDAVPEPAVWATLILGLAMVGASARRRRAVAA